MIRSNYGNINNRKYTLDAQRVRNRDHKMETKKPKLKDHGLWLWSHIYKFPDGKCYFYEGIKNVL